MSDYSDKEDDEVLEIKRAMREARARKKSITSKIKLRLEKDSVERTEMEDIMRKISSELDQYRKKFTECEFDLKETKYELIQLQVKHAKLQSDKDHEAGVYKSQLHDLQLQLEGRSKDHDQRLLLISLENERLRKLLETLSSSHSPNEQSTVSRTRQHIIAKSIQSIDKMKHLSNTNGIKIDDFDYKTFQQLQKNAQSVESNIDSAMLEMCRNLEEENQSLISTIDNLKADLAEAKRESNASQLIPHYRLAIVRSRTYAANLVEQIKREQTTSQALREQLDETYQDLKKVVDEKRRLYKKMNKQSLRMEEYENHTTLTTSQRHQQLDQEGDEEQEDDTRGHSRSHSKEHQRSRSDYFQEDHDKEDDVAQEEAKSTAYRRNQYRDYEEEKEEEEESAERDQHTRNRGRRNEKKESDEEIQFQLRNNRSSKNNHFTSNTTASNTTTNTREDHHRKTTHASSTLSGRESADNIVVSKTSNLLEEKQQLANRMELEHGLRNELQTLDDQIDILKDKLSKAALARSQKILNEVFDANGLPNLIQPNL